MAKNSENKLNYLQMPLPKSSNSYKSTKREWGGLNYRQTIDTGMLSQESNISTLEYPYLIPSRKHKQLMSDKYPNPISMFGFDDFLMVIYRKALTIYVDYITMNSGGSVKNIYTGILNDNAKKSDEYPRCVVQFNVYDTPTDPVSGEYIKKLLIFPDRKSMDFEITDDFEINDMSVLVKTYYNNNQEDDGIYPPPSSASRNYYYKNTYNQDVYRWVDDESDSDKSGWKISVPPSVPSIKYAAVHLSRLFGVDDARVYASGYNDYTNWNLDTVSEYNESNAWVSPSQSNTNADGSFTGITCFQGHVICFKNDYMHEIYNTKNPFRIQDIYAEGTIDNRTIQDVDGKLIFVSEDDVKIYTGSNPRIIGYNLNMSEFINPVSGTDGRNYYLYCEKNDSSKHLFVYDTYIEQWSERKIDNAVLSFAHNKNGMYMLLDDGYVYEISNGGYSHNWSFETDLITNQTVDIKHIRKLQMFANIANGAYFKVYVLYDDEKFNESTSHLVYSSTGDGQKVIRVKPRQTASYGIKLHIEGYGYVKLYELELVMEKGGDLYA